MNEETDVSTFEGSVETATPGSDTLRDAMYQQAHEFVDAQLRSMSEKQRKLQTALLSRPNRHPFLFVIGNAEGSTGKVQRICPIHGSHTDKAFNYTGSKSNCRSCAGNYKTDADRQRSLKSKYGEGWTFELLKLRKEYNKSTMQVERPDGVKITPIYANLLHSDRYRLRLVKDIEIKKANLVKELRQKYGYKWRAEIEETDLRRPLDWRAVVTRPDSKQIVGTFENMLKSAADLVAKYKNELLQKAAKEARNPFSGSSVTKLVKKLLRDENIDFLSEKTFETLRAPDTNALLRFDIALIHHKIIIEIDGIQHTTAVEKFGGEAALKRRVWLDDRKDNWAFANGYFVHRVFTYKKFEPARVLEYIAEHQGKDPRHSHEPSPNKKSK